MKFSTLVLTIITTLGIGFIGGMLVRPTHTPPEPETRVVVREVTAPIDTSQILADSWTVFITENDSRLRDMFGVEPGDSVKAVDDGGLLPVIMTDTTLHVRIDSLELDMDATVKVATLVTDQPKSNIQLILSDIRQSRIDTTILYTTHIDTFAGYDEWYKEYPQSQCISFVAGVASMYLITKLAIALIN